MTEAISRLSHLVLLLLLLLRRRGLFLLGGQGSQLLGPGAWGHRKSVLEAPRGGLVSPGGQRREPNLTLDPDSGKTGTYLRASSY